MFGHLDLNSDGLLSAQEMYDLEHDQVRFFAISKQYSLNKYMPYI